MKVIIFNDKENFDGCLRLVNDNLFPEGKKRFWNYKKYLPFIFDKIKNSDEKFKKEFKLINTIFYTGEYNSKIITNFKWSCNQKIKEINSLLEKEKNLLEEIKKYQLDDSLREKIKIHVDETLLELNNKKQNYFNRIQKQIRNRYGQKKFFNHLPSSISLKSTKLKQSDGEIYQKGVDVKIATDLVHLAHTGAYDVAIILGGDSDLSEAIKLVKDSLSKIVIVIAYYTEGEPLLSSISDLKKTASKFINLKEDFSEAELINMSEPLRESNS